MARKNPKSVNNQKFNQRKALKRMRRKERVSKGRYNYNPEIHRIHAMQMLRKGLAVSIKYFKNTIWEKDLKHQEFLREEKKKLKAEKLKKEKEDVKLLQ